MLSFFLHHTYTQIYYFYPIKDNAISCDYHSIVISDQTPTSIEINFPHHRPPSKFWRFDSYLLCVPKFIDSLTSQIQLFFDINDTSDISSNILWESLRAYIQGQTMFYISYFKKSEQAKLREISDDIERLDSQYSANSSPETYKVIKPLQLQSEYNLLSPGKVERQLLQTKQLFFEQGEKSGIWGGRPVLSD